VPTALKRKSRDNRKQLKEHPGSREKVLALGLWKFVFSVSMPEKFLP